MSQYIFTSESVSSGHPDKVADRISDAILDAILAESPTARGAIEVLITTGRCVIAGETSRPEVPAKEIARRAIADIGYDPSHWDYAVRLQAQAKEIELAVDRDGAGDQGLMFGYACNETDALMPAAIHFSHRILEELEAFRRANPGVLGPDAKSQVTLAYENGRPSRVHTVLVSHQHAEGTTQAEIEAISRDVFAKVFPAGWYDEKTKVLINPSGSFVIGGPDADTGLTGRKIVVDTYGGAAPHGGGAFSGKDPTKVDRSAAYAARWLAKNVVAAGLADRCLVQLAYAIGVAEPLSIFVDTSGTGRLPDARLAQLVGHPEIVSLTPKAIRAHLGLDAPIYERTASYGHFGRPSVDGGFGWERLDLVEKLRAAAGVA